MNIYLFQATPYKLIQETLKPVELYVHFTWNELQHPAHAMNRLMDKWMDLIGRVIQ